jgi:hypothetical protein
MKIQFLMLTLTAAFAFSAHAKTTSASAMVDELVPNAVNIEEVLLENDLLNADSRVLIEEPKQSTIQDCFRDTCPVYIEVDKARQRATLRVNGQIVMDKSGSLKDGELRATTGMVGHGTPNFDRHPERPLRAYIKYSSSKYPGGDWIGPDKKAYGNMPFAIFIRGGFAVHGTTGGDGWGNISKLGTVPLSHGCVRIHPLNAKAFNQAVTTYGASNTWIYVHE